MGSVVAVKSGTATVTVTGAEKSAKVPVEVIIPGADRRQGRALSR